MTTKRNMRTDSCDAELKVLETTLQPEKIVDSKEKIVDAKEKQTEEEEEFNDEEEVWESDDKSETDLGINANLCEICRKVDLHGAFFRSKRWDQDLLPLGVLDDITHKTSHPSKCDLCRLVLHLVSQTSENRMTLDSPFNDQKLSLRLIREGRIQVLGYNHLYGEILLLHEDASFLDPAPLSRLVEKREADIALLRSWIKDCEDIHCLTGPCHGWSSQKKILYPDDLTLIDVYEKRLVKAQNESRYIALSYVWGNVSVLRTDKSNRPQLEVDGALSLESEQLPLVVRDAIELVARLGERYLWVDSLCIVQDDRESKHRQVLQMAAIYSAAQVTIVAVAGEDANAGLPGVRRGSRISTQVAAKLKGLRLVVQLPELSDVVKESHYNTRAWTFQERVLSNRCLYFAKDQVYFQCKSATRSEDVLGQSQPKKVPISFLSKRDRPFSRLDYLMNPLLTVPEVEQERVRDCTEWHLGFQLYSNLVSQYTEKKLSYDSDIIDAFSGILGVLEACCDWTFTNGLPEDILDFALLWIPIKDVVRRGPSVSVAATDRRYSSWSWAGWVGRLCYNTDPFCNAYSESQLMSAIEGFWLHNPGRTRQVERKAQGPDSELGSLTFVSADSSSLLSDAETSLLQKHFLEPYSVDVLCFRSSSVPAKAFSIPLLTNLAYRMVNEHNKMEHHPITPFYDLDGNKCGALYGDIKATWTNQSPDACGFVLLSKSNVIDWERDDPEWFAAFDKDHYECTEWCTLNVMLVKVEGDLTERLAIGQMHADAWNGAKPQNSLIRLA